jgi:primosomal protein N' (replication factor Y)
VTGRRRAAREPAAERPVARVCVDVPLAHLDRPFDYLVPADVAAQAVPGVRVRLRFAGQLVDGWLLERADVSEHGGRLAYLERVVSPEPVLSPEIAVLARAVADRYAGNLADVLRLAVPPRHARVERAAAESPVEPPVESPAAVAGPDAGAWSAYPAGPAFLRALAEGRAARAVWSALPGEDWPARIAEVIASATGGAGGPGSGGPGSGGPGSGGPGPRGVVVVVPDARDLDRLDAALTRAGVPHVALSAALGPAERYRRFLAARRGAVPVVLGTRAAMFAPVERLGLVVIWDDGDDLHAEPRAPYPHAREVLLTRAQLTGAAALVGGYARSAEAQLLVETGWAKEIVAGRAEVRARAPEVLPAGDDPQLARDQAAATARLPTVAWQAARAALAAATPVLVQVPRRGYLPSVSCLDCHTPARCPNCAGPLELRRSGSTPGCRWCGRAATAYVCPSCGGRRLRAAVVGARRTAEELGRAFPGVPVRTSGRDEVLAEVPGGAAVVVATPGAEPVADGGYGAVLLLDTWALLTRADLRAGEETLRRWLAAAALARPRGQVVVVADGGLVPVQALLRWNPAWHAARELAERRELGFPPATRMASVTGPADAVAELLRETRLPAGAQELGPVPADARAGAGPLERMLVRVPRGEAAALARALHEAVAVRTARKAAHPVRVQIDPHDLF